MSPKRYDYLRDPAAIYETSFRTLRAECDLSRFPPDLFPVVERLVHACGRPEVAAKIAVDGPVASAGTAALRAGKPILADAEMVAMGITRRLLPAANPVLCMLNDAETPARAAALATTRSAAAVDAWREHIEGAVVAVGNAPTALFHLLERLHDGWPRPAVILAFPVGFVGAAESKQALCDATLGIPFVTLPGRDGGSALAAAAVNGLSVAAKGEGG